MKKFFIYLFTIFIAFIIFLPKTNLFYLLQKELLKQNIYISSLANDKYLYLDLKNTKIYYSSSKISSISDINIYMFILYNKIHIKNIKIQFNNINIKNLDLSYTILSPLKIYINGNSNIGKIEGFINLNERKIKVYIYNLSNKNLQSILKKDNKGYFYETKL